MRNRIYSKKAITIATFFGGPLIAGFLISRNYKLFGNERASLISNLLGLLTTFLMLAFLLYLPEGILDKIPNALFPAIYTSIVNLIVNTYQKEKIDAFIKDDGEAHSNWLATAYGIASGIIVLGLIVLIAPKESIIGYENKLEINDGVTLYYSDSIDYEFSYNLSQLLIESGFISNGNELDLFLSDEGSNYKIRFILLDTKLLQDTTVMYDYYRFQTYINDDTTFLDKTMIIGFTDQALQGKYKIPKMGFEDPNYILPALALQEYLVNENHKIYYNKTMPMADIESLAESMKTLRGYFPKESVIELVFLNDGTDYILKFYIPNCDNLSQVNRKRLKSTIHYIQGGITTKINLILVDSETFEEQAANL